MDNEKFTKYLKDGIAIDLNFDFPEPDIPVDSTPVDISAERKRSRGCKFWLDKEKYHEMFEIRELEINRILFKNGVFFDQNS